MGVKNGQSKSPLFKSSLVKFNQVLETSEGMTSFKLNDGTLGFVNVKSRLEFLNMANLKLERGELIVKTEQRSSSTVLYCGNFVKMKVNSGVFSMSSQPLEDSNRSVLKLCAFEGSAEVSFESNIAAAKSLGAGECLTIEISEAGKLGSMNISEAEKIKIDPAENARWFSRLLTHKVVEASAYLDKLKSY